MRYAAHDAPGFTLILKGDCRVALAGHPPLHLGTGDFLLLPATPAFTLSSHPGLSGPLTAPTALPVRHGDPDGEADFEALGGSFRLDPANAPLLPTLLPRLIHIPAAEGRSSRLTRLIGQIHDECAGDEPGRDLVLERLLEVLLIEALRGHAPDPPHPGLAAALRDPALARALRALHGDVRASWSVATLAGIAGQSRSAFAARFAAALGCGPIEYLTRWRMALARDALIRGSKTLDRIAEEIGYESASAFSTAFRRHTGCPPGQFARTGGSPAQTLDD